MYPRIAHIYGPFWINSYGLMIALGFIVFLFFTLQHPIRKKYFTKEQYLNTALIGLIGGIIGGRITYVLTHISEFNDRWLSIFFFWEPGLFLIGALITIIPVLIIYLHQLKIPSLPILDLGAVYAPIFQVIARFGCLLSGCCYGKEAPNFIWAIIFTNNEGSAPLYTPLHPTQLYTSAASLIIFIVMLLVQNTLKNKPGLLICLFFIMENISRFIIDFWRGNREFFIFKKYFIFNQFSQAQIISIVCFFISIMLFTWLWFKQKSLQYKQ